MDIINNHVVLFKATQNDIKDPYCEILEQNGCIAHCVNVLEFKFVNIERLRQCLQRAGDFSCLVLTSPRAVEAVEMAAVDLAKDDMSLLSDDGEPRKKCAKSSAELDGAVWSRLPAYVVGQATADAACKLGLKTVGEDSGNSDLLADLIIKDKPKVDLPILFPCGNLSKETLPVRLNQSGISLESITVYETMADKAIKENMSDVIKNEGVPEFLVFFSPSGVRFTKDAIKHLNLPSDKMKVIAIGPSTETELELHGFTVAATASKPSPKFVLEAVAGKSPGRK